MTSWLGNSKHLWMWDLRSMASELESAGFRRVRRAGFGDSDDPMFSRAEDRDRWHDCLGVECVKPPPAREPAAAASTAVAA